MFVKITATSTERPRDLEQHLLVHRFQPESAENILCEVCGNTFPREDIYENHHKNCQSRKQCQCPLCKVRHSEEAMLEHFAAKHGIQMCSETVKFSSFEEFQLWKDRYEKTNFLKYTRGIQYLKENGTEVFNLHCQWGGLVNSEENNIEGFRDVEAKGWCPSSIEVSISVVDEVEVKIIKTHVGHDVLNNNNESNGTINFSGEKRSAEVSSKIMLNKDRNSVLDQTADEIHPLKQSNIHNIEECDPSDVLVKGSKRKITRRKTVGKNLRNPSLCIESWIKKASNKACVKLFKPTGVKSEEYPQLEAGGYLVLVMNKPQIGLLSGFGKRFICVDWQTGETFELITVIVLDTRDQCFPCAFLVTDKADENVVEVLFSEIKRIVGTIRTKLFMSGTTSFVSTVWDRVMGASQKKLICSWDVLREWKSNMCFMSGKKRGLTLRALKVLLEETDVDAFTAAFETVLNKLYCDSETADFASYIAKNYSENQSTWGCCFRKNEGIQVNLQLEKMHDTLKQVLKIHCGKSINITLDAILVFLRNKVFDRLILMGRGKVPSKLSVLTNRHTSAVKLTCETTNKGSFWQVVSGKKEKNKITPTNRDCSCDLKCSVCKVCSHMYSCTCFDSTVSLNMCKHIHSVFINEAAGNVALSVNENGSEPGNSSEENSETDDFDIQPICDTTSQVAINQIKVEWNINSADQTETEKLVDQQIPGSEINTIYFLIPYNGEIIPSHEGNVGLQSLTETIESGKAAAENLFKSVLSEVHNQQQLEELVNTITPLQERIRALETPSDSTESRRRLYEEVAVIDCNKLSFQDFPMPVKKPRFSSTET